MVRGIRTALFLKQNIMNEFNADVMKVILLDMVYRGLVDGHKLPIDNEVYLLEIYNHIKDSEYEGLKESYNLMFEEILTK